MSQMGVALLSCVLGLATHALLCPECVHVQNVFMCEDLSYSEEVNCSTVAHCRAQSLIPQRPESAVPLQSKSLTLWYTSALHVARQLNNSEIRHLSLVQCMPAFEPVPFEYFTVQRLETLRVIYPPQKIEKVIGKDRDALYHEEARIAVIHTSVLTGKKTELKSYTVQTQVDREGMMGFPEIFMSRSGLSETSRIFVTFLY